jgi:hypothetical protein
MALLHISPAVYVPAEPCSDMIMVESGYFTFWYYCVLLVLHSSDASLAYSNKTTY